MRIKRMIISLLAMLPISSIAFAAEYNLNIDKALEEPAEIEQEFLQKLEENQLPLFTQNDRFMMILILN